MIILVNSTIRVTLSDLHSLYTSSISWVNTLRYLRVHICAVHKFSCSICDAKKSFYRSFNCIFGKIGRIASENVRVELLETKCLSSLFYGLEACPLNKSQFIRICHILCLQENICNEIVHCCKWLSAVF